METYLYGLLGLSLAGNLFSLVNTMVANSKKRDEEDQRTVASIYEELNRKIDGFNNDMNHRVCGLENLLNQRITAEVKDVRETLGGVEQDIWRLECRLCDVEDQVELLNKEPEMELCAASKKKKHG